MTVKNVDFKELSILVKQLRKAAELSQKELADLAGVGKTLVFDLEHGSKSVSIENLLKVLKVLNTGLILAPPIKVDLENL
jgi:HTH-type transcriptional regulator/antitoxin HipB